MKGLGLNFPKEDERDKDNFEWKTCRKMTGEVCFYYLPRFCRDKRKAFAAVMTLQSWNILSVSITNL